jgi:hypothetical protein
MGYDQGPTPPQTDEIVKPDIGDALNKRDAVSHHLKKLLHPTIIFMVVGTLLLAMLAIVPIWNACFLLNNTNYTFWAGRHIPQCIIIFSVLIVVFFPMTLALYFKSAETARTEQKVMMIASTFITLFGLFLMIFSLPLTQQARSTATNLLYRCDTAEDLHRLYEYSMVLQNVRAQPACATMFSIVDCVGYEEEPPYTNFLRSMESEFHCAGFCYNSQYATNKTGPSLAAAASMLSVKQEVKRQHHSDRKARQFSIAADSSLAADASLAAEAEMSSAALGNEPATFPPTLFSDANYQASCEGMSARSMKNVAGDIGSQTFFLGLYLVLIAVMTGFLKLFGFCFRKD